MKVKAPTIATAPVDDDFRGILICAVRYTLGRKTYMPGLVTKYIMAHCSGKLTDRDITVMLRDIDVQRSTHGLGMDCDVETWEQFEQWLKNEGDALSKKP